MIKVYSKQKMKTQITLFLLLLCFISFSQQNEVKIINGIEFEFKQRTVDDLEQADYIELYRNGKKVLTHTNFKTDGDCSSENLELGTYKVKGDEIYFYSYWASGDRMQKNVYPFGFRKQIYKVKKSGKILAVSSILYVESYVDSFNKPEAIDYLHKKTKTAFEIKKVKEYTSIIEKEYEGKFVVHKVKNKLEREVRNVLQKEIKMNTKYWKEVYGTNHNK